MQLMIFGANEIFYSFRRKKRVTGEGKKTQAKKPNKSSSSNDSEEEDASDDVSLSPLLWFLTLENCIPFTGPGRCMVNCLE